MTFTLVEKSIYDILTEQAAYHGNEEAVVDVSKRYTYSELDRISDEYGCRFLQQGIRHGVRVALISKTSADTIVVFYSLMKLGAVVTLLSPSLVEESMNHALSVSGAEYIITTCKEIRASFDSTYRVFSVVDNGYEMLPEEKADRNEYDRICMDTDVHSSGAVLFTSGSTSRPKAVFLDQFRLLNNAYAHRKFLEITPDDRFASALPIDHILCIIINILTPFVSGAAVCISRDKHTKNILDVIHREHCTVLCGVPTLFHALISRDDFSSYDVSSLRLGFTGGAAISAKLHSDIEKMLGIMLISTLGQTETTGGFTMWDKSETAEERCLSVGVPSYNVRIKLVNGEICVKGYLVSDGYLKQEDETAKLIDSDGWLHTGDLGTFDKKGILYVTGRSKDIIIRGGENISANQVAGIIEECRGVSMCKVIGVPDEHRGEEICACVIRKDDTLTAAQIRDYVKSHLEYFKVPAYVVFLKEFPLTENGKINNNELKEIVSERLNGVGL